MMSEGTLKRGPIEPWIEKDAIFLRVGVGDINAGGWKGEIATLMNGSILIIIDDVSYVYSIGDIAQHAMSLHIKNHGVKE